jgi:hypothetical protein
MMIEDIYMYQLSMNITLTDARLLDSCKCVSCNGPIVNEDIFAVTIHLPDETRTYFHDDECFDKYLDGLKLFDSLREDMRNGIVN